MQRIVVSLIRHGLSAAGGGIVSYGLSTQQETDIAIGALAALVSYAWSVWEKFKDKNKDKKDK